MNSGQMRSDGWSRCSASISRIQRALRPRLIRMAGKEGVTMSSALADMGDGKKAAPTH